MAESCNSPTCIREQKEIHFSFLGQKDFSPIKFHRVNASTGKEVPYKQIVKGFEYKSGQYVVMSPADFKAANPKATQTIDIEDFIELTELDPMLFDKPYYLVPQKGGEKGYFLLRDALAKSEKVAIGKIVMRTKQHLVAILSRGDYLVLEMLRFAHEVLEGDRVKYLDDIGKKGKYSDRELKMAEELIAGMTTSWDPKKYHDTYYEDLMKTIRAKVKSGKTHTISQETKTTDDEAPSGKVVDLLPLLRESLKKTGGRKKGAHAAAH